MAPRITKKVVVSGRVQGVFYRAYTQRAAVECGVDGYVKNLADGSVEAVFQGEADRVEQMISWCRTGSPSSSVTHVTASDLSEDKIFSGFNITY